MGQSALRNKENIIQKDVFKNSGLDRDVFWLKTKMGNELKVLRQINFKNVGDHGTADPRLAWLRG